MLGYEKTRRRLEGQIKKTEVMKENRENKKLESNAENKCLFYDQSNTPVVEIQYHS